MQKETCRFFLPSRNLNVQKPSKKTRFRLFQICELKKIQTKCQSKQPKTPPTQCASWEKTWSLFTDNDYQLTKSKWQFCVQQRNKNPILPLQNKILSVLNGNWWIIASNDIKCWIKFCERSYMHLRCSFLPRSFVNLFLCVFPHPVCFNC